MKILDVKQGSVEWLAARHGVVTASEIDALVSPEWAVRKGEGPRTYLSTKIAEKLMGWRPEANTFAMDQGQILETIAIPWYEFAHDVKINRVGFCLSDDSRYGCSPDGLIGEDGGVEIKCPTPPKHISYLLAGEVPKDYRAQIQFSLFVTGRAWWKFVSYSNYLPPLIVHVLPDPNAQGAFRMALDRFIPEFDAAMEAVKARMVTTGRAA